MQRHRQRETVGQATCWSRPRHLRRLVSDVPPGAAERLVPSSSPTALGLLCADFATYVSTHIVHGEQISELLHERVRFEIRKVRDGLSLFEFRDASFGDTAIFDKL